MKHPRYPSEDVVWTRHPCYLDNTVTEVATIVRILGMSEVDTVKQSVEIKMSLNLYWTDDRLIELDSQEPGAKLPDKLWGPWPELGNSINDGFSVSLLAKVIY